MKKSVIAILLISMIGLLLVGCSDLLGAGNPEGGDTTKGTGSENTNGETSQTGESLLLTFNTILNDTQKQAVEKVLNDQFSTSQVSKNIQLNESIFSIMSSNNISVKIGEWTVVENKSVYTIYKATITVMGTDLTAIKSFVESAEFTTELAKVDNTIQAPVVTEKADTDTDTDSDTDTDIGGTYVSTRTNEDGSIETEKIIIVGNTLNWQTATNGIKDSEVEFQLEAIASSPNVYGYNSNQYGTALITATAYTLYKTTYTKALWLEDGVWVDALTLYPEADLTSYALYKTDENSISIILDIEFENNKYYMWTDDITNPVLDPEVYTKNTTDTDTDTDTGIDTGTDTNIENNIQGTYTLKWEQNLTTYTETFSITSNKLDFRMTENGSNIMEYEATFEKIVTRPSVYPHYPYDGYGDVIVDTTGYDFYKVTYTKYQILRDNGWEDTLSSLPPEETTGYVLFKTEENILYVEYLMVKDGKYYFYGDSISDLNTPVLNPIAFQKENTTDTDTDLQNTYTYTSMNGSYIQWIVDGSTLNCQNVKNGVKYEEFEISLETISTSPTEYGHDYDQLGTKPITATDYTLYKGVVTKYLILEEGEWIDVLTLYPDDFENTYIMYNIDGNVLSIFPWQVISENGKYYIWSDDINNPELKPEVYTKQ